MSASRQPKRASPPGRAPTKAGTDSSRSGHRRRGAAKREGPEKGGPRQQRERPPATAGTDNGREAPTKAGTDRGGHRQRRAPTEAEVAATADISSLPHGQNRTIRA